MIEVVLHRLLNSTDNNGTASAPHMDPFAGTCFAASETCPLDLNEDGSENQSALWFVGVIVSIIGSVLSNFGVNTQKYSMIQEIRHDAKRSYIAQPIWMVGLVMVVLGAVADFAALGFAAQSLITPVGGFTMVANLFFAHYWLGEVVMWLDLVSTAFICLGIVLVAAFADKSNQCFTLESLMCLYTRYEFIGYAVVVIVLMIVLFVAICRISARMKAIKEAGEHTSSKIYTRYRSVAPLLCAGLSGVVGAQSVLFAKSTIEIFKSAVRGNPEFTFFGTYVILIFMFAAIVGQIHWLAVGLKDYDAVIMVPVFQCVFVTFTILGGAAYFDEFRSFSVLQSSMFCLGLLFLVAGVLGLAMHKSRSAEELLLNDKGIKSNDCNSSRIASLSDPVLGNLPDLENNAVPGDAEAVDSELSIDPTSSTVPRSRNASISQYDDFNHITQFGAFSSRVTPALLLWDNALDVSLPSPATFFRRFKHGHMNGEDVECNSRRHSFHDRAVCKDLSRSQLDSPNPPDLPEPSSVSSVDLVDSSRNSKSASFAGIEHLLSLNRASKKKAKDNSSKLDNIKDSAEDEEDSLTSL